MARERRGFIVSQVCAVVQYTDQSGQSHKITTTAKTRAANPHKLTDAQKQKLRLKNAERIIRDTSADLKKQGASNCKGSVIAVDNYEEEHVLGVVLPAATN